MVRIVGSQWRSSSLFGYPLDMYKRTQCAKVRESKVGIGHKM